MVYGKLQTTFSLLTEETAIKWKLKVSGAPATDAIKAGMIVTTDSTGLVKAADLHTGANALATAELAGVAYDEYSSTLDYSQGSGFITVILGPHIGKTTQFNTSELATSNTIGQVLYSPATAGTKGCFGTATDGIQVGNVVDYDGTWLTYFWTA